MSKDQTITQEINENRLPLAEVSNPDRSIDEDHHALLRRGTSGNFG
jgi:hypothetical protein